MLQDAWRTIQESWKAAQICSLEMSADSDATCTPVGADCAPSQTLFLPDRSMRMSYSRCAGAYEPSSFRRALHRQRRAFSAVTQISSLLGATEGARLLPHLVTACCAVRERRTATRLQGCQVLFDDRMVAEQLRWRRSQSYLLGLVLLMDPRDVNPWS